jgi:cellulose synthase/poly-beta-1,6-N-acetylglucosamine synthase-like glycosyltransferase
VSTFVDGVAVVAAVTLIAGGILGILIFGYPIWLRGRRQPFEWPVAPPAAWPSVEIVVPVHDELALIDGKLRNLAALSYPDARLTVRIVDGASSDGTPERIASWSRRHPQVKLLRVAAANKIAQLNAALDRSDATWILVTDADALLEPDTLARLVAEGDADPDLAVVGTFVEPAQAHPLERLHWRMVNRLRRQESRRGCASIVNGPCYLFRRALLTRFPDDVVADDAHVALVAAASRRRVACIPISVIELRAPRRFSDLVWHKSRRADAYLRELFRFLPHATTMRSPAREVFWWRLAHMVAVPVLGTLTSLGVLCGLVSAGSGVGIPLAVLAAALLAAAVYIRPRSATELLLGAGLSVVLIAVLLGSLITHRFSRQTACYRKVGSASVLERIGQTS